VACLFSLIGNPDWQSGLANQRTGINLLAV